MACRWICDECRDRGWEWRLVTPDSYHQARRDGEVNELFSMADRGVVFFDDMDQALRDREQSANVEDQSVFLTALDGMRPKQGVVFVFTTNCELEQIDRAFKRPGRIDVVLNFKEPDAEMRRQLLATWHAEIREHLDEAMLVASTDGYSFADLEEIKNLLVMRFIDRGVWDWPGAIEQFTANRTEATARRTPIGFQKQSVDC
ncbi:MAG: AAA family ATPase [Planctomycetes bacterium]|nr:AAA family ATPase [Planctomycetota bacterium]